MATLTTKMIYTSDKNGERFDLCHSNGAYKIYGSPFLVEGGCISTNMTGSVKTLFTATRRSKKRDQEALSMFDEHISEYAKNNPGSNIKEY